MASEQVETTTITLEKSVDTTVTPVKQKTSLPIRMLEEEVWFSGSELKTDNSSSDDEQIQALKKEYEERIKKGARKKTKFVCNTRKTTTTTTQLLRTQREKNISETMQSVEQITSTSSSSSETSLQDSFRSIIENVDEKKNQGPKVHFKKTLKKIIYPSQKPFAMIGNENINIEKIQKLEERLSVAETAYLQARSDTDQLLTQMHKIIGNVSGLQGSEWNFFSQITKKWIDCLSWKNSEKSLLKHSVHQPRKKRFFLCGNTSMLKNQRKAARRKRSNDSLLRNIKLCTKPNNHKDSEISEDYEEETDNVSHNEDGILTLESLGYQLSENERENLFRINNAINFPDSYEIGDHNLHGCEKHEIEEKLDKFLKRRNLILQGGNINYTDEDYQSCDEDDI